MEKFDIIIIGAGVVGLSVAAAISQKTRNVALIERHLSYGEETSSRNSEVIHAGIYYEKGWLKGKLCVEGNRMMYDLCRRNHIPHKNTGKLIIAVNKKEEETLSDLLELAQTNGAEGVRIITSAEIKRLEPNVEAQAAIYCPSSGIVDSHNLMKHFEAKAVENGVNIVYGCEVERIDKDAGNGYMLQIRERDGSLSEVRTQMCINCAGLESANIAAKAGVDIDKHNYRLHYRKGIYFRATHQLEKFPQMLIYPVPPEPGSVGIHTTPDLAGGMRLGPHFFWVDEFDYKVDLACQDYIYKESMSYLPFINKSDLQPDLAGIHPERFASGELPRDYVIQNEADKGLDGFINLVGIGSPGLTASPAIGKYVADLVDGLL